MSFANKKASVREAHFEEARGNIAHPGAKLKDLITHTMGPGSDMSQDVYGDSYMKKPITPSRSDVFGSEASNQGFRLNKRGK
jgi:hypothetical protein